MKECRDCRSVADRLTPYVDGTLPPPEREAVERHLHECPPCRDEARDEADARTMLRDHAPRLRQAPAPPQLRTRCEALARAECAARLAGWRRNLMPAAVAAALILSTVAAIAFLASRRSNTVLAAQLTEDHTRCFLRLGGQFPTLDAVQVEQALESRYGWDVHVPAPTGTSGMQLVEGRRCLMSHGGVPHILYRVNGQDLSLYVFEGVTRPDGDVTMLGQRTQIWSRGANSFALVSSADAPDVERAINYVRAEAH